MPQYKKGKVASILFVGQLKLKYNCNIYTQHKGDRQADGQPLYTAPPDHLALVAAAEHERDNALGIVASAYAAGYTQAEAGLPSHANQHTAAQAALTAIERAAYERGVRDAAAEAADWWSNGGPSAEVSARILALLTQEGR